MCSACTVRMRTLAKTMRAHCTQSSRRLGASTSKLGRCSFSDSSSSCVRLQHRKTPRWATDFPWMVIADEGEEMLCALCRKHNRHLRESPVGRATWVGKNITRQSLVNHAKSVSHELAVKMEADLASSKKDRGIAMALDKVMSAERKAFIGALKCMYFLTKIEMAHTTNFVPLSELGR